MSWCCVKYCPREATETLYEVGSKDTARVCSVHAECWPFTTEAFTRTRPAAVPPREGDGGT